MAPIKSVVIVGGGTAGWLTAGILAAHIKKTAGKTIKVTLIESSTIPPIGVGEGTWPTMRNTLQSIGVAETDFIRECNATFKQGAKFSKWVTGAKDDYYYHPLILPDQYNQFNFAPYWHHNAQDMSFSNAVCSQETMCELGLAPKTITTPEYQSISNYSYHLDAGKFSSFLSKHCIEKLGVQHIVDDVIKIENDKEGYIASLHTKNNEQIHGDLFVDCTGLSSMLLGQHYSVPFKECKDILFNDSAIAVHVPYSSKEEPIASHTISTATQNGWIWDIGLSNRKGVGHVYSSKYTSDDMALKELHDYVQKFVADPSELNYRKISFTPGHREKFWHKNCIAIGLSAGFLEPLEASSLLLVEISAMYLAEQLPANRHIMPIIEKRFNDTFQYRWDRIIDFLKLHYILSKRTDSQYWLDNRDPKTIPSSLTELMTLWEYQYPWHDDFDRSVEVFPAASYQYVLYGMGFKTKPNYAGTSDYQQQTGRDIIIKNQQNINKLAKSLPSHRDLINKVHQYGFQRI